MIPYIESHSFSIGPVTLQTWGTLVALGFIVAAWIAAHRAAKKGLDPKHVWDMSFWIFLAAIVGSRIFHVLFYEPSYYLANPLDAIDPRQPGYAFMGGLLAGAAALWFYVRRTRLDFLAYADTLAWGVPWGCGIGRIGCFLIHDHPGTLTSFVLGVRYPDGQTRHDLGLYLSIFGFVLGIVFLIVDRTKIKKGPGFWVGLLLVLQGIGRLLLDFLRVADTRWGPLTPTQWLVIATVALGAWLLMGKKRKNSS